MVVNEYGCSAASSDVLVVICDSAYQPMLDDNGSTAWMLDSALYSNLQWYDDNGIINGANQSFYMAQNSGWHYIVATDSFGCVYSSDAVLLSAAMSSGIAPFSGFVKVFPNPITSFSPLTIQIEGVKFSQVTIELMDMFGRNISREVISSSNFPYRFDSQYISGLSNGLYYIDILFEGNRIRKKIVKAGF